MDIRASNTKQTGFLAHPVQDDEEGVVGGAQLRAIGLGRRLALLWRRPLLRLGCLGRLRPSSHSAVVEALFSELTQHCYQAAEYCDRVNLLNRVICILKADCCMPERGCETDLRVCTSRGL